MGRLNQLTTQCFNVLLCFLESRLLFEFLTDLLDLIDVLLSSVDAKHTSTGFLGARFTIKNKDWCDIVL